MQFPQVIQKYAGTLGKEEIKIAPIKLKVSFVKAN